MSGWSPAGWDNFFVAQAGAAAALAGLLFVALSNNVAKILQHPNLPGRAGETLALLIALLLEAMIGLTPEQSPVFFGAQLIVISTTLVVFASVLQWRSWRRKDAYGYHWMRILSVQAPAAWTFAAGVSLVTGMGGGLHLIVRGTLWGFIGAGVNAWVLLVEVLR